MERNERVRAILTELEATRENLLALSDDIWQSIDHNDDTALEQGIQFKREYNKKVKDFSQIATELSAMVQQFTDVRLETATVSPSAEEVADNPKQAEDERQRLIRELDREIAHSLDENFTFKRPYGFVLGDYAAKDLVTWKQLYHLVCSYLAERESAQFAGLCENKVFISSQGNHAFAHTSYGLREPQQIIEGVYAETNLSANSVRDSIEKLLHEFSYDPARFKIYLREDRNAAA